MENKILVTEIFEDGNVTHGAITQDELCIEMLVKIIGMEKATALILLAKCTEMDFYSVFRYFQYVCLFMYEKEKGLSLKISDFKNNIDNALEKHTELNGKGWDLETRNKYCAIVQDIIDNPLGSALMSTKTPIG